MIEKAGYEYSSIRINKTITLYHSLTDICSIFACMYQMKCISSSGRYQSTLRDTLSTLNLFYTCLDLVLVEWEINYCYSVSADDNLSPLPPGTSPLLT